MRELAAVYRKDLAKRDGQKVPEKVPGKVLFSLYYFTFFSEISHHTSLMHLWLISYKMID